VVGGAALGWAAGGLTHLLLGAPDGRPSLAKVRKALGEHGLDAHELEPVGADHRNSSTYVTAGDGEPGLFVKAVGREWRDTDLLYRAWSALTRARAAPRLRFTTPLHKVEHEASMALLAAAAGVRAPQVLLVRSFGNGAGLLVERRIDGRSLAELDPEQVDDALLAETWRQVGLLHGAGMAHGEPVPANVMVDQEGRPWLVDFDQAAHAADERPLAHDTAALLAGLGGLVGPERAEAAREAAAPAGTATPRPVSPARP
jgi:glycosyltransferase 2 family protein